MSRKQLLAAMLVKGVIGFLILGILVFGSAGSLRFLRGWLLVIPLFLLMLSIGILLLTKYPATLEKRMQGREREKEQRGYIALIGVLFLASFVIAGLDYRLGWTWVPLWGSAIALAVMVGGYILFAAVILQNAYASRVVEVQENQTVISTGLYSVVRHPMYTACLLLFLAMPVVLGSWLALVPMLAFPIGLILRIKNEEAILRQGLGGYSEYTTRVKYRLIPYIW